MLSNKAKIVGQMLLNFFFSFASVAIYVSTITFTQWYEIFPIITATPTAILGFHVFRTSPSCLQQSTDVCWWRHTIWCNEPTFEHTTLQFREPWDFFLWTSRYLKSPCPGRPGDHVIVYQTRYSTNHSTIAIRPPSIFWAMLWKYSTVQTSIKSQRSDR